MNNGKLNNSEREFLNNLNYDLRHLSVPIRDVRGCKIHNAVLRKYLLRLEQVTVSTSLYIDDLLHNNTEDLRQAP